MFEHFTTPLEIFSHKLGSALAMEQDSLDLLADMEQAAMRSDLKELFLEHANATRQQIQNLEQCFDLMGQDAQLVPSPTTKGLAKETNAFVSKTDDTLVDAVVLAGALESAHHQRAVYEVLTIQAKNLGISGTGELLDANLREETAAVEKILAAFESIARADADAETERGSETATAPVTEISVPPYIPPGSI